MLGDWKSLILESGGAIVSPFSPFSEMEKRFFVERNRYIACWSKITFVLEAKRRSGTMLTAKWAKYLERDIAVLPCAPNNCGLGGLDLIVDDGGIPIRDYQDILAAFDRARIKTLPAFEGDESPAIKKITFGVQTAIAIGMMSFCAKFSKSAYIIQ